MQRPLSSCQTRTTHMITKYFQCQRNVLSKVKRASIVSQTSKAIIVLVITTWCILYAVEIIRREKTARIDAALMLFGEYVLECKGIWLRSAKEILKQNVFIISMFTVLHKISIKFLVSKFCGKAQFPHCLAVRPKLYEKFVFPQNFHITKLGEIKVFYAVIFVAAV